MLKEKQIKNFVIKGGVLGFIAGVVILSLVFVVAVQCLWYKISFISVSLPLYCRSPIYGVIISLAFPINFLTDDLSRAFFFAPLSFAIYVFIGILIAVFVRARTKR